MATSTIEWTQETWNPVSGCTRVSAGCDNCYAVKMTNRLANMGQEAKYGGLTVLNSKGDRHFNGKVRTHEDALTIPLRKRKPTTYFVNSMSDLFHKDVPFEFIDKVLAVAAICPHHTFQVLTKRPERMADYMPGLTNRIYRQVSAWLDDGEAGFLGKQWDRVHALAGESCSGEQFEITGWNTPLPNVWLGTSCENQEAADERIPHLLRVPATVRFLSCEPLLGEIEFSVRGDGAFTSGAGYTPFPAGDDPHNIHWVIVGGESGPGARPMNIEWARSIVAQCKAAEIACFVKQLGSVPIEPQEIWRSRPLSKILSFKNHKRCPEGFVPWLLTAKGGNMDEWTEDLRVREMPTRKVSSHSK